ncbi:hypothetical protein [Desulfatirhabdium butyrativorans]|uniref:hypothetical protein n=1 Tax=Desulfatirhabdium butyrativorans TaxID=340467 RepID=UPI000420F133|nr:hypothetical protein [Desulfatirhabdium butyrativorans]
MKGEEEAWCHLLANSTSSHLFLQWFDEQIVLPGCHSSKRSNGYLRQLRRTVIRQTEWSASSLPACFRLRMLAGTSP